MKFVFWQLVRTPKDQINHEGLKKTAVEVGVILKDLDNVLESQKYVALLYLMLFVNILVSFFVLCFFLCVLICLYCTIYSILLICARKFQVCWRQ